MSDIAPRIVKLLRDHLGTASYVGVIAADIDAKLDMDTRLDASFVDDLHMDSLDLIEITMATEEEFEIEISDDEADAFGPRHDGKAKTIRDWCALIEGKRAAKAVAT